MTRDVLGLLRAALVLAAGMLAVMALELAVDVAAGGYPLARLATFDVQEMRHLHALVSRSSNQLVAVVFTTVAIAVPLTANLYSLKFLEFFLKDRVNAAMLTLVVFANVNVIWAGYAQKNDAVPAFALHAAFGIVAFSFALVFPYLYYVFRLLHPHALLQRLEREIGQALTAEDRTTAAEGIEHIANVAVRSVERADRSTAIEGVLALERVVRAYWERKDQLPAPWFEPDPNAFLGFSSKAVAELGASRTWMEMKVLAQLRQVMSAAAPRMHDVVATGARMLRKLGLEETAHRDPAIREMLVSYFNTFLRLALNRRDVRSVYVVLDQYRLLAETWNARFPELGTEIARYFRYYGGVAREQQMPFVVETGAHDLGHLVRAAWETGAPNRDRLLEELLRYDAEAPGPLAGVRKAQALLASFFLAAGHDTAARRVAESFAGVPPATTALLRDDLLAVIREKYWEVTERRMNLEWVPEPQRERLRDFFAMLGA